MTRTPWYQHKERGSAWGLAFCLWLYRLAGRGVLSLVVYPVILYFFITGGQARRASKAFLRRVYQQGSPALTSYPGNWASFKHFLSFAQAILDKIDVWMGNIRIEQVSYEGYNRFERLLAQKQGAVFIGSHLGNLEVCRALGQSQYPVRINVLVFTAHAPFFNQLLKSLNQDVELNLIQVTQLGPDIAIMLKERVEQGEFVVIMGDRTPVDNPGRTCNVPFLGEPAAFSQGPVILASLLECPVLQLFCMRDGEGFRIIFEDFAEPKLALVRKERQQQLVFWCGRYAQRLAEVAKLYPMQWFNFFDFWQLSPQDKGQSGK
ncbi:acyltransferase [Bowmanella sp. Y26]|uniref:LpxL/LpxP family acyltransferase n=1 Tax=Bowmanella yangjiangensis TaxID=2811230 RepID=UPI001BDDBB55|nr:acyltransferase [Bowmanella yangjiangensis]MBT1064174.1 acyltransferase [Bowmanella yangjiangensis]